MTGIHAINRTSMKKLSIFMFCHHQPWSIKQWDPTFKRPSVNYTQMFLLIVFLIEIFLTWNSGCNFSIKTFSQKEQKYWKLVFVHCWTWSDGDCRSGRIVSCPKCKCWLVPRSDLMDHITSQGGQCASAPGFFFDMIVKRLILNQYRQKLSISM